MFYCFSKYFKIWISKLSELFQLEINLDKFRLASVNSYELEFISDIYSKDSKGKKEIKKFEFFA